MNNKRAYQDLRKGLTIDSMRLDQELIEHPMRVMMVTEHASDALQLRDAAKHALDITTADAAQRLRNSSEEKLSETRITSLLPLDELVQQATTEYELSKHELAYWQGMVEAYREKGSSMKRIAELTIAGFLAPNAAYSKQKEELAIRRRPIVQKRE
jgi:hypothetical protein